MRVAVRDGFAGEQALVVAQRVDDLWAGFPDIQPAKQRQFLDIAAIALHRVQDVVVGDAVGHAGVEILYAVSGRAMHDTGAVVGGGVVGQKYGAEAAVAVVGSFGACVACASLAARVTLVAWIVHVAHIVQRVHELELRQMLTLCRGQHAAGETKACQAFFHQHGGQQQDAALGIDQRVVQLGVQVQRLIGGNRPGGRRPDDGEGVFVQAFESKRGSQFFRLSAFKTDIERLRFFIGIFDFKLGQRTAAIKTPVHGLQAAIDKAALHDAF